MNDSFSDCNNNYLKPNKAKNETEIKLSFADSDSQNRVSSKYKNCKRIQSSKIRISKRPSYSIKSHNKNFREVYSRMIRKKNQPNYIF